ncbi:hypothetical protein AB1Y20_018003 [Prymnesium parvum]|uniref:Sugar phosphate transporter domain-containing protein n=1 Tax=Prymnesium parvum TaxID=97485 RepID=A0AB34JQJ3_PRYPA
MVLGLDTALKQGIFTLYVLLWVSCHLLVYRSKHDAPAYNSTSVVLLTELVKLLMATGLYLLQDGGPSVLWRSTIASLPLLARYSVPALLYCVYNNLVYTNLTFFDPGTYNVLMQLRIIMTGLLYQALFAKRLNRNQWLAIVLIAVGCMCKEAGKLGSAATVHANLGAWVLLGAQMLCSVLAGVYNEVLLKSDGVKPAGVKVTTNLQNAFMYCNSILWNGAFLAAKGTLEQALSPSNWAAICTPLVLSIIAIMSTVGLVTGFFLKHLDSVLKAIASALEVVATCLMSFVLFGVPLDGFTLVASTMVGFGVALYSRPIPPSRQEYELLPGAYTEDRGDK